MKKVIPTIFLFSLFINTVSFCSDPVRGSSDKQMAKALVVDKNETEQEEPSERDKELIDLLRSFSERLVKENASEQKIYDEICALQNVEKITSDEKEKLVLALKLYCPFYREQLKKMKKEGTTRKELAAMLEVLLHKKAITVKQFKSLEKELRLILPTVRLARWLKPLSIYVGAGLSFCSMFDLFNTLTDEAGPTVRVAFGSFPKEYEVGVRDRMKLLNGLVGNIFRSLSGICVGLVPALLMQEANQ